MGILKPLFKLVSGLIWVYSYFSLGAMMAIAAVPAFLLGQWGWNKNIDPAWAGTWAPALDIFVGMFWSIMGFFLFGIGLMAILPIFRLLFLALGWKPHMGSIPIHSFRMWFWYNHNGMMFMFSTVFGRFARATTIYPMFLRAMGAKIGKDVVFNTQHVYDLDIIEVGDRTVIGANASLLGHVGEKGNLLRAPIKIGKYCTIGQYTNVFPGVTMGDNCHVGAMSLIPKGATLDANAIYGGIPVKKIRDLEPGQRATADDVSATTGSPHNRPSA